MSECCRSAVQVVEPSTARSRYYLNLVLQRREMLFATWERYLISHAEARDIWFVLNTTQVELRGYRPIL
jgi:hypothetical protein